MKHACLIFTLLLLVGCQPAMVEPKGTVENSIGMKFVPVGRTFIGWIGSPLNEPNRWEPYWPSMPIPDEKKKDIYEPLRYKAVLYNAMVYLGQTEVTNAQYRKFRPDHVSEIWKIVDFDLRPELGMALHPEVINWLSAQGSVNGDSQPVTNVTVEDAKAFCRWLNSLPEEEAAGRYYFIPSELIWEHACRAETRTAYFWGDDLGEAGKYANIADKSFPRDHRYDSAFPCRDGALLSSNVASYQPNPLGLYDMHGNVREWTSTEYKPLRCPEPPFWGEIYEPDDPKWNANESKSFVIKGGSWSSGPGLARSAAREMFLGDEYLSPDLGFRVAMKQLSAPAARKEKSEKKTDIAKDTKGSKP